MGKGQPFQNPGDAAPKRIRYCPKCGRRDADETRVKDIDCDGCFRWLYSIKPFKAKRGGES